MTMAQDGGKVVSLTHQELPRLVGAKKKKVPTRAVQEQPLLTDTYAAPQGTLNTTPYPTLLTLASQLNCISG